MKNLEITEVTSTGCTYIQKWITGLFPDHQKRREFVMFLSQINRGVPIEEAIIIKYASQIDETIIMFFIAYIGRDHLDKYSFEKEMPGMTWIKDVGSKWADTAYTFIPEPLPSHDIYTGARQIEAFEKWLKDLNKLLIEHSNQML
jgi:hypothetical protein